MCRYRTLTERRRIKSNFRLIECASTSLHRSMSSRRFFTLFREIDVFVKCTVNKFIIARRTALVANKRRIISSDLSHNNRKTQVSVSVDSEFLEPYDLFRLSRDSYAYLVPLRMANLRVLGFVRLIDIRAA